MPNKQIITDSTKKKYIIAGSEYLTTECLRHHMTKAFPHMQLAACLEDRQAVEQYGDFADIDLVLSDVRLADSSSLEVFDSIGLQVPIVFFGAYDTDYYARQCGIPTARFLMKPPVHNEIAKAVNELI